MSKAQRYKQQQKDAKAKSQAEKNPTPVVAVQKTLKERQAENKEQLRKHQASVAKLKEFEAKLHPVPAGATAASAQPKDSNPNADMFFDGGNLSKDQSRTGYSAAPKESTPVLAPKPTPAKHEQPTPIA